MMLFASSLFMLDHYICDAGRLMKPLYKMLLLLCLMLTPILTFAAKKDCIAVGVGLSGVFNRLKYETATQSDAPESNPIGFKFSRGVILVGQGYYMFKDNLGLKCGVDIMIPFGEMYKKKSFPKTIYEGIKSHQRFVNLQRSYEASFYIGAYYIVNKVWGVTTKLIGGWGRYSFERNARINPVIGYPYDLYSLPKTSKNSLHIGFGIDNEISINRNIMLSLGVAGRYNTKLEYTPPTTVNTQAPFIKDGGNTQMRVRSFTFTKNVFSLPSVTVALAVIYEFL